MSPSWRRGGGPGSWKVAADRVDLSYVRDPDLDTPLTRNAMPVLRNLHEHLDGQPISVILTDAGGVVLSRLTADHDLERHLDGVQLAPGLQLRRGVRRHQRHRHRPGGRPARARVRARALRRGPGGPRLRRRPDPRPDLRQDRRRRRPDLLAQGRRRAADRARQDHRRPDHQAHCWTTAARGSSGCCRSTCGPAGTPAASCWRSPTTW